MKKFMARILALTFVAACLTAASARAALPDFDAPELDAGSVIKSLNKAARELPSAQGSEKYDPRYFEIDPASVVTQKLDTPYQALEDGITLPVIIPGQEKPGPGAPGPVGPHIPPAGDGLDNAVKIINIAEKIWNFIESNKPVVNVTSHYANAVPEGTTHWTELESWSKPENTLYSFSARNGFGKKVVDVTYIVLRTTGGKRAGKGKFLTGVTIIPVKIDVLWGFKFDMGIEVPSVANVGTAEEPVASMTMNVTWTIQNNRKVSRGAGVYYLQGDGHFQQLASPFAD